jgi:DNA-binding NarL/FixJ family response regulator
MSLRHIQSVFDPRLVPVEIRDSLGLTPRQFDVVLLLADGRCSKQIANTLKLSPRTIEIYRIEIADRLVEKGVCRHRSATGVVAAVTLAIATHWAATLVRAALIAPVLSHPFKGDRHARIRPLA